MNGPWRCLSGTAEHRGQDARRPSLGGSRWPSEDVSRQLDLPKKDGTVHNTVLSHWTNSKKLFLINGLGAAFCFLRPLQVFAAIGCQQFRAARFLPIPSDGVVRP